MPIRPKTNVIHNCLLNSSATSGMCVCVCVLVFKSNSLIDFTINVYFDCKLNSHSIFLMIMSLSYFKVCFQFRLF